MRKIAIIGGTGFVGQHIASVLAKKGYWQIKILTRRREDKRHLLVLPTAEVITTDLYNQDALNKQLKDCDTVINLVGILNERGHDGEGFYKAHVELAEKVIEACQVNGIKRLLHMSALNADAEKGSSHYLRTKGKAENLVLSADNIHTTSFKPSVIFGGNDSFFNRFAQLLKLMPAFFPLACPDAKFAPIWVNDVAHAMVNSIDRPDTFGKAYNLCGPKVYTLRELVEYTAKNLGLRRKVIGLSDSMSHLQARVFERIPGKPFSVDNYGSLQTDSICDANHLVGLGVEAHAIETIMPKFLAATTPRDHYQRFRMASRR